MDKLGQFYEDMMNLREEYLKLHWENPGLFRAVIFTDDETDSLRQLKGLLKFLVENHTTSPMFSFENDTVFRKVLDSKMNKLKLKDNLFIRKSLKTSTEEYQDKVKKNPYHQIN